MRIFSTKISHDLPCLAISHSGCLYVYIDFQSVSLAVAERTFAGRIGGQRDFFSLVRAGRPIILVVGYRKNRAEGFVPVRCTLKKKST